MTAFVFSRPAPDAAARSQSRKLLFVMVHSGTKSALHFIAAVRKSAELKIAMQGAGSGRLQAVCDLAQEHDFSFTEAELRAAFKHDWAMRWHRFRIE